MISVIIPSLPGYSEMNLATLETFKKNATTPIELILHVGDNPFAVNVNAGLRKATGDIVLISNNDVTPLPGWDRWLVDACHKHQDSIISMTQRSDCGWCFGMYSSVLRQVGFLDEKLVNSYEDYDFFIRAALLRINRVMPPLTYVLHEGGHTLNKVWGKCETQRSDRFDQCVRNRNYMLGKWPDVDIDNVAHIAWAIHGIEIMEEWKVSHAENFS